MNGYNGYYVDEQTLREVIETVGKTAAAAGMMRKRLRKLQKNIRWRREISRKSEMKFPSHVRAKNSNSLNPIWKN